MNILIKSCLEGARQSKGLTVIIDVINASSTIVNLFEAGAKSIIPVESIKKAKEMKKAHPDYLLCAEARYKFSGIDLINSPLVPKKVKGRTVVIKTHAGTKGLLWAKEADRVVVGCFLNSGAVADFIKKIKPKEVTLVPMGNHGKTKAIEDELCAVYFKDLLEGKKPDFEAVRKQVISGNMKNILRYLFQPRKTKAVLKLNTSKKVLEMVDRRLVQAKNKTFI